MDLLPDNTIINIAVLVVSFYVLSKGANFLVDGAVGIAYRLRIAKVIIGVVLVGFGTTTPEFTVSVISAVQGHSEIALGNAVGSVIANVALALALGVLVAHRALCLDPSMYLTIGAAFFGASVLSFAFAINGEISRIEGGILIACLVAYLAYLVITEKKKQGREYEKEAIEDVEEHHLRVQGLGKNILIFCIGLALVILASKFLVEAAINIAETLSVSKTVIGLTIFAIGTSLPEIATCIVASRKGHGDLAFGDIMGANILNLLWITAGAALARPIVVSQKEIFFMFPYMLGIVAVMFVLIRVCNCLNRWKSGVLLFLYASYVVLTVVLFFPSPA